jgi:penicillin amidase
MNSLDKELLRRLGSGESIAAICQSAEWTASEFETWWKQETARRAPRYDGQRNAKINASTTIERDRLGIPHIFADDHRDLWFGFGYAMAQDRLFQMDYLRRKGLGRLAEVLGKDGLSSDLVARTVGLNRIAQAELPLLPAETREILQAFSAGVNAWIEECDDRLPIEFDLLDYRPESWSPIDSLAIENEFRWYLTGRFPVIVMPELAKRVLGDGPLYREYLLGEEDEEAIVPPESYRNLAQELAPHGRPELLELPREQVGQATGDSEGTGSNNWVVAGCHCRSKAPMVASDPHIAIEAVSCWYEAHLHGGEYNAAGMAYVGMPALLCGRNERIAWGITNNICSQRDLYQEKTDSAHPNHFLFDGHWEASRELVETIQVKNAEPVNRTIRFSRNGPIVDEILPPPANQTGPVSLKWLGAYGGGWLTALLGVNRARSVVEFREALRPWHVPTFNMVVADVDGHIAVQSTGRIPLRKISERGYRPGWEKAHQWIGLLPFDAMPHAIDPPRGWLVTANNRLAGNDYPYPLYGTWIGGHRALRIRQMIEAGIGRGDNASQGFTTTDFGTMHHDTVSLRAVVCVPRILNALGDETDSRMLAAIKYLRDWDGKVEADSVASCLFNVFFARWSKTVADVHFEGTTAELLAKQAEGVASRLLAEDPHGWFRDGERIPAITKTFAETLEYLTKRLGSVMADWQWGRLHQMPLKHVLSNRGDLSKLLDQGGGTVKGDMITVCNTGCGPDWQANTGAGYRLIADLATDYLLAVDAQSQSGQPGTSHYSDQFADWHSGKYHAIPLSRAAVSEVVVTRMRLDPEK